jgi:hypothetical protein
MHIIASNADDHDDIMHKRSKLCNQINNVLCFFGKRTPMVKLNCKREKIHKSFCSFLLPKCAKTHLRAFVKSKIFPGVIPPDPHLKGRGGRSC